MLGLLFFAGIKIREHILWKRTFDRIKQAELPDEDEDVAFEAVEPPDI
jgi:hypothetical protein